MHLARLSTLSLTFFVAATHAGAAIIVTAQAGPNTQTGTTTASASTNFTDSIYTYAGTANINASYFGFDSSIHDVITGTCVPFPVPCGTVSLASKVTAQITDQLFLTAPSGGGFLQVKYQGSVAGDFNVGGRFIFNGQTRNNVVSSFSDVMLIPFTNGVAVPLSLSADFGGGALLGGGANFGDQSGIASFSLDPLLVFDRNMVVQAFSYSTASGTTYRTANGTFTPEPSTFAFIGLGLGAIGAIRSRAKRPEQRPTSPRC